MDKIAAKTFASQFIELGKSQMMDSFQRLVVAVKNSTAYLIS